jgi:hypothetical protein
MSMQASSGVDTLNKLLQRDLMRAENTMKYGGEVESF